MNRPTWAESEMGENTNYNNEGFPVATNTIIIINRFNPLYLIDAYHLL